MMHPGKLMSVLLTNQNTNLSMQAFTATRWRFFLSFYQVASNKKPLALKAARGRQGSGLSVFISHPIYG